MPVVTPAVITSMIITLIITRRNRHDFGRTVSAARAGAAAMGCDDAPPRRLRPKLPNAHVYQCVLRIGARW